MQGEGHVKKEKNRDWGDAPTSRGTLGIAGGPQKLEGTRGTECVEQKEPTLPMP